MMASGLPNRLRPNASSSNQGNTRGKGALQLQYLRSSVVRILSLRGSSSEIAVVASRSLNFLELRSTSTAVPANSSQRPSTQLKDPIDVTICSPSMTVCQPALQMLFRLLKSSGTPVTAYVSPAEHGLQARRLDIQKARHHLLRERAKKAWPCHLLPA